MRSDGGAAGTRSATDGGSRRDVAKHGTPRPNKPAPAPFVPTKGAIAPNGIRFK